MNRNFSKFAEYLIYESTGLKKILNESSNNLPLNAMDHINKSLPTLVQLYIYNQLIIMKKLEEEYCDGIFNRLLNEWKYPYKHNACLQTFIKLIPSMEYRKISNEQMTNPLDSNELLRLCSIRQKFSDQLLEISKDSKKTITLDMASSILLDICNEIGDDIPPNDSSPNDLDKDSTSFDLSSYESLDNSRTNELNNVIPIFQVESSEAISESPKVPHNKPPKSPATHSFNHTRV
ncbi:hypothetical protein SNEBB_003145 [Seison nebaliae]|nr:hypothetical protein SNEBB_003145 [Seison nebaliae]